MMDSRERAALDRYITGNYGEDQFRGEDDEPYSAHREYAELRTAAFASVYEYDSAEDGPECEVITRILAHHPLYRPGQEGELLRFQQYVDKAARAMYGERYGRLGQLRKMKVLARVICLHLGSKAGRRAWN